MKKLFFIFVVALIPSLSANAMHHRYNQKLASYTVAGGFRMNTARSIEIYNDGKVFESSMNSKGKEFKREIATLSVNYLDVLRQIASTAEKKDLLPPANEPVCADAPTHNWEVFNESDEDVLIKQNVNCVEQFHPDYQQLAWIADLLKTFSDYARATN